MAKFLLNNQRQVEADDYRINNDFVIFYKTNNPSEADQAKDIYDELGPSYTKVFTIRRADVLTVELTDREPEPGKGGHAPLVG